MPILQEASLRVSDVSCQTAETGLLSLGLLLHDVVELKPALLVDLLTDLEVIHQVFLV